MSVRTLADVRLRTGRLTVTWTWTNWTVGVWWDRRARGRPVRRAGVDLGPLEAAWQRLPARRHVVVNTEGPA